MNATDLFPTIAVSWPPRTAQRVGPFMVPNADAGGNRVSAARLKDPTALGITDAELNDAEATMQAQGRLPLFQVLNHQDGLSDALDTRGYIARDHTDLLLIQAADLAAAPPPVTAFTIWPPLAIQTEIWDAGGIDAPRRAVMDRATFPKTSLFGRINDKPAGAAFVGMSGNVAMLHALEVVPMARRAGLASTMMRAAADWARKQGAEWFSVLVTQQNTQAQRLYASLGLKAVGTYCYRVKTGGPTR
ncbi:GNAT family N-acetyltransferase [Gymnodinialimonas ulvae]|uniref:GNAT family N-acetyltransferase n=1 Tax=Gymnodinialimonas ulvae TaxID=3126504 RepID=UPI00309563BC